MQEKYVWKVTFETNECDEDGEELCESRDVIADSFEAAYQWAKENVEIDEGAEDGYTGIAVIKRISDKLEVV